MKKQHAYLTETDGFVPIALKGMEQVKLMNRTDTKYWFHSSKLPSLLKEIQDQYYILTIGNENLLAYTSVYYDTPDNRMFSAHHNGKLNRFKIRRRSYVSSGISFLEVKFKNNKGRTIKKRISTDFSYDAFTIDEGNFLNSITPFTTDILNPSLENNFKRITLVNKNMSERCTIDLNLQYKLDEKQMELDNLVIVEIKSEGHGANSPLALALRNNRIKTAGFSKYCIGRTLIDSRLKRNSFKPKIRQLEKMLEINTSLYA